MIDLFYFGNTLVGYLMAKPWVTECHSNEIFSRRSIVPVARVSLIPPSCAAADRAELQIGQETVQKEQE